MWTLEVSNASEIAKRAVGGDQGVTGEDHGDSSGSSNTDGALSISHSTVKALPAMSANSCELSGDRINVADGKEV